MSDGLQPKFMVSVSPALLEHACVLGRGGISWKQFVPTWGLKAQACLGLACLFEVISVPGSDRDSSQTLKWGDEQFCDPLHNLHPVSLHQACSRPAPGRLLKQDLPCDLCVFIASNLVSRVVKVRPEGENILVVLNLGIKGFQNQRLLQLLPTAALGHWWAQRQGRPADSHHHKFTSPLNGPQILNGKKHRR